MDEEDDQTTAWGELDTVNGTLGLSATTRPAGSYGWLAPVSIVLPGISAAGGAEIEPKGNIFGALSISPNWSWHRVAALVDLCLF